MADKKDTKMEGVVMGNPPVTPSNEPTALPESNSQRVAREEAEARMAISIQQANERAVAVEKSEQEAIVPAVEIPAVDAHHRAQVAENVEAELSALNFLSQRQAELRSQKQASPNPEKPKSGGVTKYLEVKVGYRGRPTGERYITPGTYAVDDENLFGQADFLIKTKRAVWVRKPSTVEEDLLETEG